MTAQSIVFLQKANDELISHCRCDVAWIGAPAQMDCPWCGCGWLFVCPRCRKAFTFARAVTTELTWEQLAHLDLDGKYGVQPTPEDIEQWIGYLQMLTKGLEVGREYVYLDGWVIPTDETDFVVEGAHARHELAAVPQTLALSDRQTLEATIGSRAYWEERQVELE